MNTVLFVNTTFGFSENLYLVFLTGGYAAISFYSYFFNNLNGPNYLYHIA